MTATIAPETYWLSSAHYLTRKAELHQAGRWTRIVAIRAASSVPGQRWNWILVDHRSGTAEIVGEFGSSRKAALQAGERLLAA